MSDELRDDLRTTSDEVIADADGLKEIERREQDPVISNAELERLAVKATTVARNMGDNVRRQELLAHEANREDEVGSK